MTDAITILVKISFMANVIVCLIVFGPMLLLLWALIDQRRKKNTIQKQEETHDQQRPSLGLAGWLDIIAVLAATLVFVSVFTNWMINHRTLALQPQYSVIPLLLYAMLMCFFLGYRALKRAQKKKLVPLPGSPESQISIKTFISVLVVTFLFLGIAAIFPPPIAQWLAELHIPTPSWLIWVIIPAILLWEPIYRKLRPATKEAVPPAPKKLSHSLVRIASALVIGTMAGQILIAPDTNQKQCDDMTDPDRLINACTAIIQSGEAKAGQYNNRGVGYAKKGQYDQALRDYNQALSMEPDNAIILSSRGSLYIVKKQYDLAIEDLNRAIRINPNYANAHFFRGLAYLGKGLDDEAIGDLTQVIRLEPNNFLAFLGRGRAYLSTYQFSKAIEDIDRASSIKSPDADAFFTRGVAKFYGISPAAAVSDLAMAVQINPFDGYKVLWLHLARVRSGENDSQEFERNSTSLLTGKWPAVVIALYRGKTTVEAVMKSVTLNSTTQPDQTCEANFYIGELYLQASMKDDAKRFFQTADIACPRNFTEQTAAHVELKAMRF